MARQERASRSRRAPRSAPRRVPRRTPWSIAALGLTALALAACGAESPPSAIPDADPEAGRLALLEYGCASCHTIPDVESVTRTIGPDLTGFGEQVYIAGQLPNRPEELIRWIRNPQEVIPGTAMPNSGVTEQDARDIAAYLYSR